MFFLIFDIFLYILSLYYLIKNFKLIVMKIKDIKYDSDYS